MSGCALRKKLKEELAAFDEAIEKNKNQDEKTLDKKTALDLLGKIQRRKEEEELVSIEPDENEGKEDD